MLIALSRRDILVMPPVPFDLAGDSRAFEAELLRKAMVESGKVQGHRTSQDDLIDQCEGICPDRVVRSARLAGDHGADRLQAPPGQLWRQAVGCARQCPRPAGRCRSAGQGPG